MTTAAFTAICSAIATGSSAIAAWKSFSLAKSNAERTSDAERRALRHEIEETARSIEIEGRRSARAQERVRQLTQTRAAMSGASTNSGTHEVTAAIEELQKRIAGIRHQAAGLATSSPESKETIGALADRLPRLRPLQVDIRGILEDALAEIDRLSAEISALIAQRDARWAIDRAVAGVATAQYLAPLSPSSSTLAALSPRS